jgi:chorismate mutase
VQCRGIRGAITVGSNTKASITSASRQLLTAMVDANGVSISDIAGIWFSTTFDLNAEFPAVAARELGWGKTALMCGHEMNVPGSLGSCLRIMMLVNTEKKDTEIIHVYLEGAKVLRADINTNKD